MHDFLSKRRIDKIFNLVHGCNFITEQNTKTAKGWQPPPPHAALELLYGRLAHSGFYGPTVDLIINANVWRLFKMNIR